ncbi:hypothetical protein OJ996_05140 [Luteolibacter sp. GHJ8]|uniref:Uncharacterized protein n=1 Tax=Luteolibacter rhizosphaerae TaxID=2989719 RepID=A0ABT3FZD2_9BACT|nr:DUF6766 family protein [Luteolibacter rhizosphaerae]MCW1912945.1 hypothetical protein [Luteolibacter rhizosphaerae]
MKRFLRNNGLSLVLLLLFLAFWAAQSVAGHHVYNDEQLQHGQPAVAYGDYLASGHFWQATGENWESEFLQMGFYVILTTFLFQKGSAESNDPEEAGKLAKVASNKARQLALPQLPFTGLPGPFPRFVPDPRDRWSEGREWERAEHGKAPHSFGEFVSGSQFWFQSFQNWQSEFLAVLSIVVLSIFLRQDGSPESKDVEDPDSKTGT